MKTEQRAFDEDNMIQLKSPEQAGENVTQLCDFNSLSTQAMSCDSC